MRADSAATLIPVRGWTRCLLAVFLAVGGCCSSVTSAGAASADELYGSPMPDRDYYGPAQQGATALMTPPAGNSREQQPGAWADGGSEHPSFSQDNRVVRLFAFDSAATNLLSGDRNGQRDVFVLRRNPGGGNMTGRLLLASVSSAGLPANGPSAWPALDGSTHARPHCVAFESEATNLDPRDRSRDPDIYLRDLRRDATRLISRGNLSGTSPVVDGRCATITFESSGWVLVASVRSGRVFRVARGQQDDQQTNGEGVAYVRGDQVWYRSFHLDAAGRHLRRGREQLVSDTPRGRGGNGSSSHPSLDDEGRYVAFQSNATDLCGRRRCRGIEKDWNGPLPDVYRRTLSRRAPTHDSMEEVNASFGVHVYGVPAVAPVISNGGENVIFIVPGSSIWYMNPGYQSVRIPSGDVATWSFPRGRGFGKFRVMHRAGCYPSRCVTQAAEVTMSARGNYIAYASTMPEFCAPRRPRGWPGDRDCPGFTDIFMRFMGWSHEGKPLG